MKILHCADIHLGSKIEAKFSKDKTEERKRELRSAFGRMVQYAKDNDINVIILAGDAFDSDRPLKRDKEFFYNVIKSSREIDFLYLRGNHDILESYTEYGLDNLKTFSGEWSSYEYGDVVISGIELGNDNAVSLYSTLKLDKDKKNIVVLHGQTGESSGKDKIQLKKLRNKNIDYLALGHVHSYSSTKIDERGVAVYSGCLEGRGFDECGEKGFVEIDISESVSHRFIKNSYRMINEVEVDLGDVSDVYTASQKVKSFIKCSPNDIVRVILTGDVEFDAEGLDREIEKLFARDYYVVIAKNRTVRKYDVDALSGDISLRGEFVRAVLSSNRSQEEKDAIISCGLRALDGREVE